MSDFLRASIILFQLQLVTALRSIRFIVCALLAALPVGFAAFLALVVPESEEVPVHFITWMPIGQVVCPIVALVFGSAVVSEEVTDRTITYLFSRPIPRAAVLFGRWLAAMVLMSGLLAASTIGVVFTLTTSFPNAVGAGSVVGVALPVIGTLVLGAAVYSAAFTALGTILKNPMILGIGYVFAFEVMLVNFPLPGNLQRLTVQFHLRSVVKESVAVWKDSANLFVTNELITPGGGMAVLGIALVAWLGVASLLLSRRQYELTA